MDRQPIRYDADTWLCMRNDPIAPKAVIRRYKDVKRGDVYLIIRWDLDPAKRLLMASAGSLEQANELVRYDSPQTSTPPFAGYPHQTPQRTP